jgi:protein-histidine pros-kinase
MLAGISHDLRTPLTRLALRVESLTDATERERFGRDIRAMETMIRDTLGYLQGESAEEAWVMLDVATVLHSAAEDRQDCGQPVTWTPAQDVGNVMVKAQLSALRRALDNLIDNALFYGSVADLSLRVEGTGPGAEVHLTVADRGPGIPAEERARVLQPFVRLEASRNRHTGGTGLGLAVVHDVARRHGGRVALHDRPGGGLQAELILPVAPR